MTELRSKYGSEPKAHSGINVLAVPDKPANTMNEISELMDETIKLWERIAVEQIDF